MNIAMIPETTQGVKNRNVTVTLLVRDSEWVRYRLLKFEPSSVNGMIPAGRKDAPPKAVLEKFPEAAARIRELFRQSTSFQSLCEDYRDCLAAWQHWRQAASEDAPALYQSYAELLRELEQEVRQYLEPEQAPGSKP
jgi:hypothetical protein